TDIHGVQVSNSAAEETKEFLARYKDAFDQAEKLHMVPREVISSLLFIESRHGKNTGNFHVPSAYLHLLQAARKPVQTYLQTQTHRYTESVTPEQRKEILKRTVTKSKWALAELKALQKVHRWKWKLGTDLRGSFSGAFGMPQFIPSSYVRWARSIDHPAQPNLSKAEDAIVSVAHYLKDHGWKTEDAESRITALMKYNNSRDYADAILALAKKIETRSTVSHAKDFRDGTAAL
ncbi:MAG: lytic murein transglycosylase, partial [Bdellovibrionota bacterium]